MWEWIQGHVAVILVCAVLAAIVVLIIRGLVRDRKKGKSTCGANCAHCAMAGSCHGGTHPAESTRSRRGRTAEPTPECVSFLLRSTSSPHFSENLLTNPAMCGKIHRSRVCVPRDGE